MKEIKISVIGLGKLGLPIYQVIKSKFPKSVGIDVKKVTKDTRTNFKQLGDLSFVIVPTPSKEDNTFSSEYVENVLMRIKKKKHIVVIVSTLMPGETDRLQKKFPHLKLVYSPTLVALDRVKEDFTHPDIVLIGTKSHTLAIIIKNIIFIVTRNNPYFCWLTPLEAEIAKIALNCYITTKITFANQIGNLCHRLKIKPDKILEAIGNDSRIGTKYFKAGLGYGGCCFPRDNLALSAYCIKNSVRPSLFTRVHELNQLQVWEIVRRVEAINPKSIGFSGFGYKENSRITECSALKDIYNALKKRGYNVKIGKGEVNIDNWGIK